MKKFVLRFGYHGDADDNHHVGVDRQTVICIQFW